MEFARISSDNVLEKRCNYSKFLDFNLIFIMIIPELHFIFDLICYLISFNFSLNFRILKVGTPPLPLSRWLRRDFKVRDRTSRQVRDRPALALGSCRHHQVLEPGLGQVREPRGTEPNELFRSELG